MPQVDAVVTVENVSSAPLQLVVRGEWVWVYPFQRLTVDHAEYIGGPIGMYLAEDRIRVTKSGMPIKSWMTVRYRPDPQTVSYPVLIDDNGSIFVTDDYRPLEVV